MTRQLAVYSEFTQLQKCSILYWFVCYEVNRSSHKYTGGQSRDQSLFENGMMWGETERLLSISTGRVGS